MGKLFNVSSSPHVRNKITTQSIMFDVAIAMIPASVYGVWQFGMHALLVLIATVVACVLNGLTEDEITVHLLGGDILVKYDRDNDTVWMTGPAAIAFEGTIEI